MVIRIPSINVISMVSFRHPSSRWYVSFWYPPSTLFDSILIPSINSIRYYFGTLHQLDSVHSHSLHQPVWVHSHTLHQHVSVHSHTLHQPVSVHSHTLHQPVSVHSHTLHQLVSVHCGTLHQVKNLGEQKEKGRESVTGSKKRVLEAF